MIKSCDHPSPSVQLLAHQTLNFPSASAIEAYGDTLYVFGDNAPYLLLLSSTYKPLDSIWYWPHAGIIEKDVKPDIESAVIVAEADDVAVLGLGSMSTPNRFANYRYAIRRNQIAREHMFDSSNYFPGIAEVNIEGACLVDNQLLLANRANLKNRNNHLLLVKNKQDVQVIEMQLPASQTVAGVSGLYYLKEKDLLLLTASEEATASATEDGEIGESYLGWIKDFSKKMSSKNVTTNAFLKLSEYDVAFRGQKIESVCAEQVNNDHLILHLVADNDDGKSKIFKIRLTMK